MILSGIRTFSFVDYPKKISAVIYTGGCNFKCPWCHNWKIAYSNNYKKIPEDTIIKKLIDLKKRLNAVCITGGEPTINNDLFEFIQKIKQLDYEIKLDTNGTNPKMLEKLLKKDLINYVAMDIKSSPKNYEKLTNTKLNMDNIFKSIDILRKNSIDYEFRMTFVPNLSNQKDIEFFENFINQNEKGYITIANSTEIFKINKNVKLKTEKLIIR
ncbi:hypothetical protein OSSY52_09040 [Tepiditoga spiralis]|uniref:Radical SAM core domain-containing protein n=1 Tax=Tepiditoga spiralis TaxID=2108365 RepID=A0A7G1G7B0_9BACT|nr:anaerobic ribonucleoside-triphosphate reductase activating protein [Tepiditoga spiralis]BBE30763.1 hypothetical protein OSSY52_09040 [Tepiditoga spiralis]